jgi:hypothetical protein
MHIFDKLPSQRINVARGSTPYLSRAIMASVSRRRCFISVVFARLGVGVGCHGSLSVVCVVGWVKRRVGVETGLQMDAGCWFVLRCETDGLVGDRFG